ncbi:hypothetical protein AgCh_014061 [Apium graveolens]
MQRSKVATLRFLRGKVKKRVLAWDGSLISQGGKEILVKSVAQTLPTYAMSVFLLPAEIHRDIERTISKFWWNSRTGDRKGWMSWDRLSRHKSVGGMGFQDFKDFNLALLGKQGWHFLTKSSSLVSRVYKARYFPTVNFLEAKIGHNPSYIWRSILEAKELVASGIRWKRSLDEEILMDLFTERDQECIKKIKIGEYGERDELYWNQEIHGCYSNKKNTRLYVIVANAKQYLEQWRYAQSKVSYSLFPQAVEGDGGDSWVRPQGLAIKVSVDATIFREFNASGIGLVARDSKGEMIMARTVSVNEVLDPNMVEIMAIKEALSWTKNTTWQNTTVQSDCLVAVQAVRSKVPMISPFGLIVEECRKMLQEQNTMSVSFIKQSANVVAHELARASYSFPDRDFNRSFVPIDVDVTLKAVLC